MLKNKEEKVASFTNPSGVNAVNATATTQFSYQILFTGTQPEKALLAAPMVDDITLTYSYGWRYLEHVVNGARHDF